MAEAPSKAQTVVHGVELFSSLLALGSAAALTYYAGPFARVLSYCGLGVYTGATGLLLSVLFLIKAPKLLNAVRGLLELLLSIAWAAFFVATGALMAQMLNLGVCNYAGLSSLLTVGAHRKLLQTASSSIGSFDMTGLTGLTSSLTSSLTGAATSLANALGASILIPSPSTCAASAVLTAAGFLGFCAFLAGAVMAVNCDLKKGRGLWAPASMRTKATTNGTNGAAAV